MINRITIHFGKRFLLALVGLCIATSQPSFAQDWFWTLNGGGTFSGQERNRDSNADEISGTWSTTANGFLKFSRSGGDGPHLSSSFFGLEFTDHFFIVPPVFSGETKFIATISSGGGCPAAGAIYNYNFIYSKWDSNDVNSAATPAFGSFQWNTTGGSSTATIDALYNLSGLSSVSWWPGSFAIPVTDCSLNSDSVPTATATGGAGTDRAGTFYLNAKGGLIFKSETDKLLYGVRRQKIPGDSALTGDYACMLLRDDASGGNTDRNKHMKITFSNAGTSGSGYTKSDVESDTNDTGYGQISATISSINSPLDGFATGTIRKGAGSNRNLACLASLDEKVILYCTFQEFNDANMAANLLCFSDSKKSGTVDHHFDESGGTSGDGVVLTDVTGTTSGVDAHGKHILEQADGKYVVTGYADKHSTTSLYGIAVGRYNANGTLDTTFATNTEAGQDSAGWRRVTVHSSTSSFARGAQSMLQGDKIIVSAYGRNGSTTKYVMFVRLNSDGTTDTSFGSSGVMKSDLSSSNNVESHAAVLDSSNRPVGCGTRRAGSSTRWSYAIWRATSDGTLDTSFGSSSGYTAVDVGSDTASNQKDKCFAMKEQDVGGTKYYITGGYADNGSFDTALVRFKSDGTQDTSFSTYNGDLGGTGANDFIYGLDIDSDGKIVTVGFAASPSGSDTTMLLARWNADGSADTTFNSGQNYRAMDLTAGQDKLFGVKVDQETGKIYAFGQVDGGGTNADDATIFKFNSDGTLDTTFGAGGVGYVSYDWGDGDDEAWFGIQDSKRRIIAVGNSQNNGWSLMRVFP